MPWITPEIVSRLLIYDPEEGELYWKARGEEDVPDRKERSRWNSRYAGKMAGSLSNNGYWTIQIRHKSYQAHRLAWMIQTGKFPPETIDHINRNPLDNRWWNLRDGTGGVNCNNLSLYKNNTSGYPRVSYHKATGKWQAKKRGKYLGLYPTPEEAYRAAEETE